MKDTHSNNPAIIFHHLCEDFVWREALSTNELFQVSEEIVIFVTVKVTIPDLQKKNTEIVWNIITDFYVLFSVDLIMIIVYFEKWTKIYHRGELY